jgi:hypothetical protein
MRKKTKKRMRRKMRKNNLLSPIVLYVLCALLTQPLMAAAGEKKLGAKEPYALIFGTVFGVDAHPAPGVKVKIRRAAEKKPIELVSDSNGEFAHRFPAGAADYTIWADLKDKQAAQKTEVKVHVENDERQDVTLHLTNQSSK